ncbi:unnamed protein product [Adineta ricciae]|uniref:glycogenin glucosyltransferase n=1 Tax=Adineta ricciae TaxID=249248 RepID=A0A814V371_ADIRI|nr:unnamed protein product [Adineta ricciae]CAF1181958.1 unnamed protein product [Adineta ricciae]
MKFYNTKLRRRSFVAFSLCTTLWILFGYNGVFLNYNGNEINCTAMISIVRPIQLPSITKFDLESNETNREAFVTLITGDTYVAAALVLGYTLKKHESMKSRQRDMIALIKHGLILDEQHRRMLEDVGWKLIEATTFSFPGTVIPRLIDGLLKLHVWSMTQYARIAVLDADAIVTGSIEEPFKFMRSNMDIPLLAVNYLFCPKVLEKKTYMTAYFNAGVLFLRPNIEHYEALINLSSKQGYYHLKFPQQNLLNTYFLGKWLGLSVIYNYVHRNAVWFTDMDSIRIVHYAGTPKPWEKIDGTQVKSSGVLWPEGDLIWQKFFVNMTREYGWKKHHYLGENPSEEFQQGFDFERLNL